MQHPIASTGNGTPVYVDLIRSAAATHISTQPHLLGLVKETLEKSNFTAAKVRLECDMGRDIGYDFITETTDNDTIFYAQLLRQKTYTRFTKNGKANSTSYLTIVMQKDENGEYELLDTWIGRLYPPTPGSKDEDTNSQVYWAKHALIFDKQPLQLRTVTKECPY